MNKLDEIKIRHVLGAAAVAGGAAVGVNNMGADPEEKPQVSKAEQDNETKRMGFKAFSMKQQARALDMASTIQNKYKKVDDHTAMKIANLAIKYEKPTWPKAEDILAVCGIESSMKPDAKSALKNDPAIGLMQVRAKVWGLNPNELQHNVEHQIKVGSKILNDYYKKVGSVDGALQAYNVGITNYMKKKGLNPRYVPKFDKERAMYESMYGNVLLEASKIELLELQQEIIDIVSSRISVSIDAKKRIILTDTKHHRSWYIELISTDPFEAHTNMIGSAAAQTRAIRYGDAGDPDSYLKFKRRDFLLEAIQATYGHD